MRHGEAPSGSGLIPARWRHVWSGAGRDHREGVCRSGRSLLTDPSRVDRQSPALDQVAIPGERDWSVSHGGVGCCTGVAAEHISSHRILLGLLTPRPGSAIGWNRPAFPARAARSAMAPWLSPAIPTARQTKLDQCFSNVVPVRGNARQLASVAVKSATDQFDPMTRHLGCQFIFRSQRREAFCGTRSVNLRHIDVIDADLLAPASPVVDGEGIAIQIQSVTSWQASRSQTAAPTIV